MSLFQYLAINKSNKKIKGIIDAGNLLDAQQKLIQKSCTLLKIYPLRTKTITKNITPKEVLQFTIYLSIFDFQITFNLYKHRNKSPPLVMRLERFIVSIDI